MEKLTEFLAKFLVRHPQYRFTVNVVSIGIGNKTAYRVFRLHYGKYTQMTVVDISRILVDSEINDIVTKLVEDMEVLIKRFKT